MAADSELRFNDVDFFQEDLKNPRTRTEDDVIAFAKAIAEFGFRIPLLALSSGALKDGHFRVQTVRWMREHMPDAYRAKGLDRLMWLCVDDLSEAQILALSVSVNRQAERSRWHTDLLGERLELIDAAGIVPLGEEGPIGFGLGDVSERDTEEEKGWDLDARTEDVAQISVRVRVPRSFDVRRAVEEALAGHDVEKVEVSVIQRSARGVEDLA
ncbi:MAG: hypothetical protein ACTHU0_21735 [Kofleriaceae bacterium]